MKRINLFFYYRRKKNYRRSISVGDSVSKLITDGICVLHWRKISVGKTVKSCSDNFEFLRGGGHFSPLGWLLPFSSLILFYILWNLVSILQNSPPLSKLFTFKYFNNYFLKKKEIALHEIFKLWLRGAKLLK
jgi:hypothetical protein